MKHIFNSFFSICNPRVQSKIEEFQNYCTQNKIYDPVSMTYISFQKKYNHLSKNDRSLIIKDSLFELFFDFTKKETIFKITTDISWDYNFISAFIYSKNNTKLEIEFKVSNKNNTNNLFVIYDYDNENNLKIIHAKGNSNIHLKSKKSSYSDAFCWDENIYSFSNINIIQSIITNYKNPEMLNDILLLTQDFNYSEDEILFSIINQAILIQNELKNKNNLKEIKNAKYI